MFIFLALFLKYFVLTFGIILNEFGISPEFR